MKTFPFNPEGQIIDHVCVMSIKIIYGKRVTTGEIILNIVPVFNVFNDQVVT